MKLKQLIEILNNFSEENPHMDVLIYHEFECVFSLLNESNIYVNLIDGEIDEIVNADKEIIKKYKNCKKAVIINVE